MKTFTALDLARSAGLRPRLVEELLQDFCKQGFVRRTEDGFEATRRGIEISRALAWITPDRSERER